MLKLFLRLGLLGLIAATWWVVGLMVSMCDIPRRTQANPATTPAMEKRTLSAGYKLKHSYVPLSEIPTALQRAVVLSEDPEFYSHRGFSLENARLAARRSLEARRFAGGASTITVQTIRHLYLKQFDPFWKRRGTELMGTVWMESLLSKERILELYLNYCYWGFGCVGADSAACFYFHKNVWELNCEESVILASMVSSANNFPDDPNPVMLERQAKIKRDMDCPED